MKVIVKIKGGLGNQLFQYATARAVYEKTGAESIILDVDGAIGNDFRPYSLDVFKLPSIVSLDNSGKFNSYNRANNPLLRIGQKFFPSIIYDYYASKNVFIWDEDTFRELNINSNRNQIYLAGYWQSEKYFETVRDILLKELEFSIIPECNLAYITQIERSNSVAVHIRLGDYLNKENANHVVCDIEYYLRGIRYFADKLEKPIFYVFSDDIPKAKVILSKVGIENICYIEGARKGADDFHLMCQCKHFLMSNSTFSWWAQYLSLSKNKIVIAPSKWTTDNRNRDIYQREWVIL